MLSKTSPFIFLQAVPAPCPWMLRTQRCCWSPWHGKPCTRLLTAKVLGTSLPLPYPHSSDSVTQQGAAKKPPFPPRPTSFPHTPGWSCPPTRKWSPNASLGNTDSRCMPQSTAFPLTDPEGLWLPMGQCTYIHT